MGKDLIKKHGVRIIPVFTIELDKREINLLRLIQTFFGVGTIRQRVRKGKPSATYTVQCLKHLKESVIPHFLKYPLLTQKKADYLLFSSVIDLMIKNKSLNYENVIEILSIKSSMNAGLSKILKEYFPLVKQSKPIERAIIISEKIESDWWLIGFVEGVGNFYVKTPINTVLLVFSISQHSRDSHLINVIKNYLNCGIIQKISTRANSVNFVVYKYEDIVNRIIPLFKPNKFEGVKHLDLDDFCKVANLMGNKKHLTDKGRKEIISIKNNMNTKRKL